MRSMKGKLMLPVALGLSDGILNTLMLAAHRLQGDAAPVTLDLAGRIAVASAIESAFMLFVAAYAQLRQDLAHADRQLNVLQRGRMAQTQQGRTVIEDATAMALIAGICSLAGAGAPLLLAVLTGTGGSPVLVLTVAALGLLGIAIARMVHGRWPVWAAAMLVGGALVALLGGWLRIV